MFERNTGFLIYVAWYFSFSLPHGLSDLCTFSSNFAFMLCFLFLILWRARFDPSVSADIVTLAVFFRSLGGSSLYLILPADCEVVEWGRPAVLLLMFLLRLVFCNGQSFPIIVVAHVWHQGGS